MRSENHRQKICSKEIQKNLLATTSLKKIFIKIDNKITNALIYNKIITELNEMVKYQFNYEEKLTIMLKHEENTRYLKQFTKSIT